MIPVLSAAGAAAQDEAAEVPVETLMERAGLAVALGAVAEGAGYGQRVAVLVGPGNNGGDGYVAARYLRRRGADVQVVALAGPRSPAAAAMQKRVLADGIQVRRWTEPFPCDVVIDALFGAGFRGALPGEVMPWIERRPAVVAVDVPSGLDATTGEATGPVFSAVRTVTFQALKIGHLVGSGPDLCGVIDVADIGLPPVEPALRVCEDGDAPRPIRPRTAHKWSVGSVMVVGGAPGITGAPLLAARSALTGGAGAVALVCPGDLASTYSGMAPELLVHGVGAGDRFGAADAPAVLAAAERFDVLAVGPGLGPEQGGFIRNLLERRPGPLVLDADGINGADLDGLRGRRGPTVITPHAGEFRRLTSAVAGHEAAAELARGTGTVVLLKGSPTFVAGEELWAVTSGGPELATIGTGDVLTGLLAALWARGLDGETAARSAAHWHGRAGVDLARRGVVTADRLATEVGRWAR